MKIIKMTNAIRVKMKERQLEIVKNYIDNNDRTQSNAQMYDFAIKLVNLLPDDIERYKDLAALDKLELDIPIIRLGETGETLNDLADKYMQYYKADPNKPMLKEIANMYKELLEEEQGLIGGN